MSLAKLIIVHNNDQVIRFNGPNRQLSGPNEFLIIIKDFFFFLIKGPNELIETNLSIHVLQHADKFQTPLSNGV